tara:strand:- start:16785 stop:17600 length:816 start_codon:yes stop_codon:yes gene_type:complete
MAFFELFPKVEYDFNRQGVVQNMVDIFRAVRPLPTFLDNFTGYKFYEIKNGERPDIVSQRLYGTPDFYWTFFVINDFLHDGYRSWPKSAEQLEAFMNKQYNGIVIETNPDTIERNSDQLITNHRDSLAGRFSLGETITGATSGATGKLFRKVTDMSQLILIDVTGTFIGNPKLINDSTELVTGSVSTDSVSTYRVFKYADAPYFYFKTGDAKQQPVTNAVHIPGGLPDSDLSFVTNRAHEFEKNEQRSKIRYVDPNFIEQFVDEFEELLNG